MEIRVHGFTLGMGGKYGVNLTDKTENTTLDLKGSNLLYLKLSMR